MFEVTLSDNKKPLPAQIKHFDIGDGDFIKKWELSIPKGKIPLPTVRDSLELAKLALGRWNLRRQKDNYAYNLDELKDFIKDNPNVEVSLFLILEYKEDQNNSSILCVCHLRRTWSNNILIDFLATHPEIIISRYKAGSKKINGIGRAMMQAVSTIAKEINSKYIWGETTQNSYLYYNHLFDLNRTSDMLFISKKKYTDFLKIINTKKHK